MSNHQNDSPNVCWLHFTLESDATLGRSDGIPGLIDHNVALDAYGCPFLHGRTLKGILNEACIDILYALGEQADSWLPIANTLFGYAGSDLDSEGLMRVGHAQLPVSLRRAIRNEIAHKEWNPEEVTDALTTIRLQTALSPGGAPDPHTLRASRVILRQTSFEAHLHFARNLSEPEQALLGATVKGTRRAGLMRNRGRGRFVAKLMSSDNADLTEDWFNLFCQAVAPGYKQSISSQTGSTVEAGLLQAEEGTT